MSEFKLKVIQIVKIIPHGKVVSYGQVAVMAGIPRMARHVGNILNKDESDVELPWWRVVNNAGRLTIKGSIYTPEDQKDRLVAEGVVINDDFTFEIAKYRFIPEMELLRKLKLEDEYIEILLRKFAV